HEHCFFLNDTATTEIYTLSLHDALPISGGLLISRAEIILPIRRLLELWFLRSEEHTSELQSHLNLVCRLLLANTQEKCTLQTCESRHTLETLLLCTYTQR